MIKSRLSAAICGLSAVTTCALLSGCSASVHVDTTPKMSKEKLADTVAEQLATKMNQPKPDMTCPEDLEGKKGTTTRCTLTASDGSTLGVTVTVTSVDGNNIKFDIQADDTPTPAAS